MEEGASSEARPKALVLVNGYPSRERPAQGAFVREHARAASHFADVVVLCNNGPVSGLPERHALADSNEAGLRVLRLSYRQPPPLTPHIGYRTGMHAAVRRLRAEGFKPDVIHAHFYVAGRMGVRLGRRLGVPVVISEHSSTFPAGTVTGLERRRARSALESADLVCPVSHHLEEHIRAAGIRARFRVVPNTVDTQVFRPPDRRRSPEGPVRLASIALLSPRKGLADLLRALADLPPRHEWRLAIVGDGPSRGELQRLSSDLGVEDRVTFRGMLEKLEVAELLRESDLLVHPSLIEPQGVALIEALACGLPVVATRVGGIPEVVNEEAGMLVPPSDPDALRAALDRMLDQVGLYDHKRIAEDARRRFGYERVGRALVEAYRDVTLPRTRPK